MASLYLNLRETLKGSQAATWLAHKIRNTRKISDLDELDRFFAGIDSKYPILNDAATRELQSVYYHPENLDLPADPFSSRYREKQTELYREVSGKTAHKLEFESGDVDPEKEKFDYFPYNSRSLNMVADQLITQGLMLKNIRLPSGASIVEFGSGSGNTIMNLALTGYRTTAVEIGKAAGEVIKYRARVHGREVEVVNQDMLEFARTGGRKFAAALFVASFHHCEDHLSLLESLGGILENDGVIYFADEPFFHSRSPTVPYPWGLRLDGLSLYFILKSGWLELGFQYAYMKTALAKFGWKLKTDLPPMSGYPNFSTAYR